MHTLTVELIEHHFSSPINLGIGWYESLTSLVMLALLAERHALTDQEFNTLASQIRLSRDTL